MIALALLSTLAAVAAPSDPSAGVPVADIEWARPFVLATPEPFTRGVLLELRADPALLVPRQTAEPVLYVGATPALRFNWDHAGGCVVALAPGVDPGELASTEIWFGPAELPERISPERGEALRQAARAAGVRPLPADRIAIALAAGGAALQAADLRDVHAVAMERVRGCSATPSDLQRPGGPPSALPSESDR